MRSLRKSSGRLSSTSSSSSSPSSPLSSSSFAPVSPLFFFALLACLLALFTGYFYASSRGGSFSDTFGQDFHSSSSSSSSSSLPMSQAIYRAAVARFNSFAPSAIRTRIPGVEIRSATATDSPVSRPAFGMSSASSSSIATTTPSTASSTAPGDATDYSRKKPFESKASSKPIGELPAPGDVDETASTTLDLSSGEAGGAVRLDHLGPMVVNVDGSLSRISNWDKMTEIEQKNTLRVLGKRNKERLERLKKMEEENGGGP